MKDEMKGEENKKKTTTTKLINALELELVNCFDDNDNDNNEQKKNRFKTHYRI